MNDAGDDLARLSSDVRLLDAIFDGGAASRAALAERTGLSRPTASASVGRLEAAGLVGETGLRTTGRGRSAPLVDLRPDVGHALALVVEPSGVTGQVLDAHGAVVTEQHVDHTASVAEALTACVRQLADAAIGPARVGVVALADPVDRHSGAAVALPDEPFLVGDLEPHALLGDSCSTLVVDNDVNWAATTLGQGSFAVLHLGEGLGCAIVEDGRVIRGDRGLAGEIAHLVVSGPDGRAMPLTEVFRELNLHQSSTSTALDVEAIRACADDRRGAGITRAVADVVAALVGLCDPKAVILTGPWSGSYTKAVQRAVAAARRPVPVLAGPARLPVSAGVRAAAIRALRDDLRERAARITDDQAARALPRPRRT